MMQGDRRRAGRVRPKIWILLALLAGGALGPIAFGSGDAGGPAYAGGAGFGAATSPAVTCPAQASTSPGSLLLPNKPPAGSLGAGGSVKATYQAGLSAAPHSLKSAAIFVPSVQAGFSTTTGSRVVVYFPPTWIHLSKSGWSGSASASTTLRSNLTFGSANATLSSAWLAVMANGSYGVFKVQFQWQWTTVTAAGKSQSGGWSPATRASTTHQQPSTFSPAPYVRVLSTSAKVGAAGGSTFWALLGGNVSSTALRMLTETGTGKELNSVCLTTSSGLKTFNASMPLSYPNGTPLPPGKYIVHAHNAGNALVVFVRVDVV